MSFAPKTIPLNIIDRSYLITESDDGDARHFPMSLVAILKLKESVSQDRLITAFQALARKYPRLRLAYQLDYQGICWRRLPDAELDDYLAACVHVLPDNCPIETHIGQSIAVNNEALSQAINLFIADNYLLLRMHHSFGDGKFMILLLHLIVCELSGQAVSDFKFSNIWWKPIWRVVWQNLGQGSQIIGQFVKSMFSSYQDYKQDTQNSTENKRSPIVSGAPMAVRYKIISAENMALLNEAKHSLSLNTVLQVMIGEHLKRLKFQDEPISYTIPVDLRRYLADANSYYPSNLASQVRITLAEGGTVAQRCTVLQKQITEHLQKKAPLIGVPGEWLLALAGKKTYQAVNREWLLKSTHNDPRRFVLSSLGKLDAVFSASADLLAEDFAPQIAVPLMGGPALVFCFNSFQGRGHITLSYDPEVFASAEIDEILCIFDTPYIQNIAEQLHEGFQT
jgi:NRPS condensation-like uncharacterized protein